MLMEENQKDVRKMVMDSYRDIKKGKGKDYKEFFAELERRYRKRRMRFKAVNNRLHEKIRNCRRRIWMCDCSRSGSQSDMVHSRLPDQQNAASYNGKRM